MKIYKIVLAKREEWTKENGELTSFYFTYKELAENQLINARENGWEGYIQEYTTENYIIDFKYIK